MADINTESEIAQEKLTNSDVDIFAEAELSLNIKIPTALKNILIISGFDNKLILSNINNSDIEDMISFARNDLYKIIDKEELPKYYGLYWKNPSLFEIVPGYKRTIVLLSEYYKKLSHKDTTKVYGIKEKPKGTKKKNQDLHQFLNSCRDSSQASISSFQSSSTISEKTMDHHSAAEESSDSIILEENVRIRKTIVSWIQGKVTKDEWEASKEAFDNIIIKTNLDADELNCLIKCFCGVSYNISQFSKPNSKSKRWIYSNFQMHLLKKHIQSSSASKISEKSRITHYISKTPSEFSNAKITHNIEVADTGNISDSSSSYVIDSNVDSNTNFKVDVSQCDNDKSHDKWKSIKYQRSERLKRAREKLSPDQNLITDYFILAEKISKIICNNDNSEITKNLLTKIKDSKIDSTIKDNKSVMNNFLKKLLDVSLNNSGSANRNSPDSKLLITFS